MISESTFVFALVLVAAGLVALAWIIFDLKRQHRELDSWRSTSANVLQSFDKRLSECEKDAPASLAARVEELADAVNRLKLTHRRFAGRFDQYVSRGKGSGDVIDGEIDEELTATLALQNASSPKVGR